MSLFLMIMWFALLKSQNFHRYFADILYKKTAPTSYESVPGVAGMEHVHGISLDIGWTWHRYRIDAARGEGYNRIV